MTRITFLAFYLAILVNFAASDTNETATNETILPPSTSKPNTLSDMASSDLSPTMISSSSALSVTSRPDLILFTGSEWEPLYATRLNPFNNPDPYGNPWPATCGVVWSSKFYQWVKTASVASFTPAMEFTTVSITSWDWIFTDPTSSDDWGYESQSTTSLTTTTTIIVASLDVPYFTPSPPCCGTCSFTFGDASVYQWPITDHPPSFPTLTNIANETFIYPSIYVEFQTIAASNDCGFVGKRLDTTTTIALQPDQVSTANLYWWNFTRSWNDDGFSQDPMGPPDWTTIDQAFTKIDPESSIICVNITTSLWVADLGDYGFLSIGTGPWEQSTFMSNVPGNPFRISGFTDTSNDAWWSISAIAATYNPCKPLLSLPQQVLSLDPSWAAAKCTADIHFVRDPWGVLTSSAGFWPLTSREPVPSSTIVGASEGASIPHPFATKTDGPLPSPSSLFPEELQALPISKLPDAITLGKTTVTCNSISEYVLGPDTLAPNSQITHSNTILSLGPNGQFLEVGGTTTQFFNPSFLVGPSTITAGGSPATINGKTYSIIPGGSSIVIDGLTESLNSATQTLNSIQGIMVTAKGYIIDSQTLVAGGVPITSSGTILSLEPDGENVVVVVSTTMPMSVLLGSSMDAATGEQNAKDVPLKSSTKTTSTLVSTAAATPRSEIKTKNGALRLRQGDYWLLWMAMLVAVIGAA